MNEEYQKVLKDLIDAVTDARQMAAITDTHTTPISRKLVDTHIAACNLLSRIDNDAN